MSNMLIQDLGNKIQTFENGMDWFSLCDLSAFCSLFLIFHSSSTLSQLQKRFQTRNKHFKNNFNMF